jgi:hypothetical protein
VEHERRMGWIEDEIEGHRGMPTSLTYLETEQEIYEGYGMAEEPPYDATSLEHGTWLNANAVPLEYEHQLWEHGTRSPSWEHTTATSPEYDDEANAHGFVHTAYHAVEPQTEPPEHGYHTLWHKMQVVDEAWAADYEGEPSLYEELGTGMYTNTTYSPPPSPTPWYPPQPPTTRYSPKPNQFRPPHPHFSYQQGPSRAPRQRREYRPPRTPKPRRERYRQPRCTIGNRYEERGPPPRPNRADQGHGTPTHPSTLPPPLRSLSNETPRPERRPRTPSGSWRERPPHPHPSPSTQKRSDSPNWREARPGRPTSFKTPSSPPMDSNTLPKTPPASPKAILATRTTPNLDSLIKQAATALKSIVIIAEKLVRRANAERRIAHRSSVVKLRMHEVVHGNALRDTPAVSSLEGGTCDRVK